MNNSLLENIRKYFTTPPIATDNLREKARIAFAWHINIAFIIALTLLTVVAFLTQIDHAPFLLSVLLLLLIARIFANKHKHNYKTTVIITSLFVTIFIYSSVFYLTSELHFIEIFWMMVVILTCFFITGWRWGLIFILLNVILYYIYFNFYFINIDEFSALVKPATMIGYTIEFLVTLGLIAYIMFNYSYLNNKILEEDMLILEEYKKERENIAHKNLEKEALLKEIHHRIKNNLQVIISLLRMQSNHLISEDAKNTFQIAISRILVMSLIHQKIYENKSLKTINLKTYLEILLKEISASYAIKKKLNFKLRVDSLEIHPDTIVPLALLLNELVNISLKNSDKVISIHVRIEKTKTGGILMIYEDNSVWDIENDHTFINIFAEQLEGNYTVEKTKEWTTFNFQLNYFIS